MTIRNRLFTVLASIALGSSSAWSATIDVPSQQPTIQDGILAATDGDTVIVQPGVYSGYYNTRVTFLGKNIVLMSEAGPQSTIIDINPSYPEVNWGFTVTDGEGPGCKIDGFTIRNGLTDGTGGPGLRVTGGSSPTIANTVFENNSASSAYWPAWGGAVLIGSSSPLFENCLFLGNRAQFFGDPPGRTVYGGAVFSNNSSPEFVDCTFQGNAAIGAQGSSGQYYDGVGGAIAGTGSIILVTDCTFYGNRGTMNGSAIYVSGTAPHGLFMENSIVAFNTDAEAIWCLGALDIDISCTDIYGNEGGDWDEPCIAGQLGINGNISLDPLFCDAAAGDFTLDALSPCAPEHSGGCGLIGAWPVDCGTTSVGVSESPPHRTLLTVHPNPVLSRATFVLDDNVGSSNLEIYDPQGRLVDLLTTTGRVDWSPARDAISGVYFARLRGGAESEVVKFVVLK